MRRGFLIAVEGIDGSGKTTHSKALVEELKSMGVGCLYTAEPTDGPIGRLLKAGMRGGGFPPEVEALLFAADRLDHVRRVVQPSLDAGLVVVSDRYVHSSIAYQGVSVGFDWVRTLNMFAPKPDLAVYLDVSVEEALARIGGGRDLFERAEYLEGVREAYLRLVEGGELVMVDAGRPYTETHRELLNVVLAALKEAGFLKAG